VSVAYPGHILRTGSAHPAVVRMAVAIQSGRFSQPGYPWRVTSVWRDEGTHGDGVSLDMAPMIFVMGGFGLKTALAVWRVAKHVEPQYCWLANAELDHIHLQLFKQDCLGMNTKAGTILYPLEAGL